MAAAYAYVLALAQIMYSLPMKSDAPIYKPILWLIAPSVAIGQVYLLNDSFSLELGRIYTLDTCGSLSYIIHDLWSHEQLRSITDV